jgi:hypothetical protein
MGLQLVDGGASDEHLSHRGLALADHGYEQPEQQAPGIFRLA